MARVLIVAKTRMGENYACVGGLNLDTNESVRLLGSDGWYQPANTTFDVGHIWNINYFKSHNIKSPHNEDVLIQSKQYIEQLNNLKETLMERVQPWRGGINQLFGGLLTLRNEKAYLSEYSDVPTVSTGYRIPDKILYKRTIDGKVYYVTTSEHPPYLIPYKGFANPIPIIQIQGGVLIRVSLAKWYRPHEATEERCYLQVSGCYT